MANNVLSAIAGGAALGEANQQDERKRRAYSALRNAYGDEAGDPEAAGQLQAIDQSKQMFPLKLQQMQAETDLLPTKRRQAEATAGLSEENTADKARVRQQGAILNGAQFVQGAIDRGEDPLKAFDHVAPFLSLEPDKVTALRTAIQQNPASVKDFIASAQASQKASASGGLHFQTDAEGNVYQLTSAGAVPVKSADGTPLKSGTFAQGATRLDQGQQRLGQGAQRLTQQAEIASPEHAGSVAAAKATGTAKGKIAAEDLPLSNTGKAAKAAAIESTKADLDNGIQDIDEALQKVGPLSAGIGSLSSFVPGSPAANLKESIVPIASRVLFDQIAKMKALSKTGSTGLGALSDTEGRLLQGLQGSLSSAQSPKQLRENLIKVKQRMQESFARFEKAYYADQGARDAKEGGDSEELSDDALLQKYGQ